MAPNPSSRPFSSGVDPKEAERQVGERLREWLLEQSGPEEDPWAVERVRSICTRLNRVRRPQPAVKPVILWRAEVIAFVGPGEYIYVTRQMLHRAWWEEGAAFVLAHEMAHHDLGHTRLFHESLTWLASVPGGWVASAVLRLPNKFLTRPEAETEADALALYLCRRAGYDGRKCVEVLDTLGSYLLDHGDVAGVYGPEPRPPDQPPTRLEARLDAAGRWFWERTRGYPCLDERKQKLLARLGAKR